MMSVCFVVSDPLTAKAFLLDHLRILARIYRVALVSNQKNAGGAAMSVSIPGVENISIPIVRSPSPVHDLRALLMLVRLYKDRQFDVVHSVTPKAGLLNVVAGRLANVPIRVHTFTGQVWVTRTGIARYFLKSCDVLMASLATHLLADSPSQRDFLVRQQIANSSKISVLAEGSISGVDTSRFKPDQCVRTRVRCTLDIPDGSCVFLFTGRLHPDKGVLTLAEAFSAVARKYPNVCLLVVGPDEAGLKPKMEEVCRGVLSQVRFVGYTDKPEEYMAASDVFCLPSRREGFGSVVIEAAAVGLPAIASRIYGLTDAVEDGVTGLLHTPDDSSDLAEKMAQLAERPSSIRPLSEAARIRVLNRFTHERLSNALKTYYDGLFCNAASA